MSAVSAQDRDRPYSVVKAELLDQGFVYAHLQALRNGHHVLAGTMNDEEGLFLIDTGATRSVIDESRAAAFGVARRGVDVEISGVAGSRSGRLSRAGSMVAEGHEIRMGRVLVTELDPARRAIGGANGLRFDGVIGQDVLDAHEAIIDVHAQVIFFKPAN